MLFMRSSGIECGWIREDPNEYGNRVKAVYFEMSVMYYVEIVDSSDATASIL